MLSKGLMSILTRDETSQIVNSVLSNQIEKLLATPIGKLSDNISEDKLRAASESLPDAIIAAIQEKLPEAIKEFDIGSVVREKINNYPAEKLESLVMSVAKEHLRTIELFGAFFWACYRHRPGDIVILGFCKINVDDIFRRKQV